MKFKTSGITNSVHIRCPTPSDPSETFGKMTFLSIEMAMSPKTKSKTSFRSSFKIFALLTALIMCAQCYAFNLLRVALSPLMRRVRKKLKTPNMIMPMSTPLIVRSSPNILLKIAMHRKIETTEAAILKMPIEAHSASPRPDPKSKPFSESPIENQNRCNMIKS